MRVDGTGCETRTPGSPGRITMQRILFVTAHDDDAVLMASHFLAGDAEKVILTLSCSDATGGSPGEFTAAYAGIPRLRCLLLEGTGDAGDKDRDMNIHCDKQTTLAVMEYIREFKPDTVITNSPDDMHNDHRETSKIVQQAVFHLRTWGNYNRPIQLYCGEIFQPLAAPHMVLPADINLKRQVMTRFSSQNNQYKWLELVETLNRFRALQFNSDYAYAEAFSVICKW